MAGGLSLGEKIPVLLVHTEEEPLAALKEALGNLSVETSRARDCREALCFLQWSNPPNLIFTDTALSDGTWADVVALASSSQQSASVIVVSRFVDVKGYIDAIECGAFDYIVPPFQAADLVHLMRWAAWKARDRRTCWAAA